MRGSLLISSGRRKTISLLAPFFFVYDYKQVMIKYDDLLTVPFLIGGRDKNGLDCYGLCIELSRRNGNPLKDLCAVHIHDSQLQDMAHQLNIHEIKENEATEGDIVQCTWQDEIHIAYMLDKKSVIHATNKGVRVSPILTLRKRKYYRIDEK